MNLFEHQNNKRKKRALLNKNAVQMPMIKKYPKSAQQEVANPSAAVINQILNYSKSLEVKKMKHAKVLVQLN